MADVSPPELREAALTAADHCTDTGRAIYMIYSAEMPGGARIDCERMLLPFGRTENGVEQIIASMEPISIDGDVDMNVAVGHFIANFRLTFVGSISAAPGTVARQKFLTCAMDFKSAGP